LSWPSVFWLGHRESDGVSVVFACGKSLEPAQPHNQDVARGGVCTSAEVWPHGSQAQGRTGQRLLPLEHLVPRRFRSCEQEFHRPVLCIGAVPKVPAPHASHVAF